MATTPPSLPLEIDREDDGRWIAEIPAVSGALAYGETAEEAAAKAEALAERLEHGEPAPEIAGLFVRAA
jgi:predicted RNase H-like HicB family nuclease